MTEGEPSTGPVDANPLHMPAESLSGTATGASETNDLSNAIVISGQETASNQESLALKEKAPLEEPPPPVLYKVNYLNEDGHQVFSKEDKEPLAVQTTLSAQKKAVIEVITDVRIYGTYKSHDAEKEPPNPRRVLGTRLQINSPAIITALQSVIEYYPGEAFSDNSTAIWEPYAPLVHYEEELKAYRDSFHPDKISLKGEVCHRNENAYEHLGVLQHVLRERKGREIEIERQRHARGMATFEMLWLLYKPGTDVYCDANADGNYNAYAVRSASHEYVGDRLLPLKVEVWNMDYDGSRIGRRSDDLIQLAYDGEKEITSLFVVPCEFWKERSKAGEESRPLRKRLEERGKMFFKLAQRHCMNYDGFILTWPKEHFKGLTMVDTQLFYPQVAAEGEKPVLDNVNDKMAHGISTCLCDVCLKSQQREVRRTTSRFSSYEFLYPEKTDSLTDHQYFLCNSWVWAYRFKHRDWKMLDVYCFSDPTFDTGMIDTLVMEDGRRRLIKALAKNYDNEIGQSSQSAHKSWSADFVAGKGEGKIFLLHGKPGVGKTYTAECIAAYTKRPLLSLTISDIGTDSSKAEANLNKYFSRAKEWNTILLIDEADIFMERRENADLTRNSLVSSFLRAMENCQSILFLTTNRVGSFDDAFVSRIHISLYYRDFTEDDRRKVWTTFFNKLAKDRKNAMHIPVETILYTTGPEVASLKWNGREIRNAFQTAVALADFDNDKNEDGKIILHERHVQQIVHMSQEFKDYLKDLHRGDEAKRADRQRIRFDDFDAKS